MKTFGLIGFPLEQSFSQKYFSNKFLNEDIKAQYVNFEIDSIGEFPEIIEDTENLVGLNVTIPYKEKVIPFLDELDPVAQKIGAVNVIKIGQKHGKRHLIGFNSDVIGFRDSLTPHLKPHHTQAFILGSGGAAKAVKYALKEAGIDYKIVSRNPKKSDEISYSDVSAPMVHQTLLIINTTPLGMFPRIDGCPDIPYQAIHPKHLCFDLIYNPEETLFLKKAKAQGANTINGMDMLVRQAGKAWEIWNKD